MRPFSTFGTTRSSVPRALGLGLVLLGFLPSLRAVQFGLLTYEIAYSNAVPRGVVITRYPKDAVGPVEIPAVIAGLPVTGIQDDVFSKCTGLTSVALPSSLVSIGRGTFEGCTGLTNVTLPSSLTGIGGIGWSAFSGCAGLTRVTIPAGVASIGPFAFAHCTGLTDVKLPPSLTDLGESAFFRCTGLNHIAIPASVTRIGQSAFLDCKGLGAIDVEAGNPAYASDGGVLIKAARTELVVCPAGKVGRYAIPASVTRINHEAFRGCTGLTHVSIPSGVTSLGVRVFNGCTGLTHVTLPSGVTGIESETFGDCTGLTSVTLPEGVTYIDSSAFRRCTALTRVSLPEGVTYIDWYAFADCTGLASVDLPSSLVSIDAGAFSGCTRLTNVTLPSSVREIGSYFPGIPSGWFYEPAFPGCTALTKAVFLGNAPQVAGGGPLGSHGREFGGAAPGFTVYYLSSRQGFSSPTWIGFPATMIDEAIHPAAAWLLTHGLGYDSDLNQDPDGDGVNLLTAYALNLDPRLNLKGRLPAPALGADTLSLSFHASSPGITYTAETSTDLTRWTTSGVTRSPPGVDGRSTATVLRDEATRFLRLMVGN